jgi:hypothetical protein
MTRTPATSPWRAPRGRSARLGGPGAGDSSADATLRRWRVWPHRHTGLPGAVAPRFRRGSSIV